MSTEVKEFRELMATNNIELTPEQADKVYPLYLGLKHSIKEAYRAMPNFHEFLNSRTTEQKLNDIKTFEKHFDKKMTLDEYNKLQKAILMICAVEGKTE